MSAFNVRLGRKIIDTVFYSDGCSVDTEEVRRSLVHHDGYDPAITVTKRREPRVTPVVKTASQ